MPESGEFLSVRGEPWPRIKALLLDSVSSPHTKRAYKNALDEFLDWYSGEPRPPISKAVIQQYRAALEQTRLAPSSINLRLAALRKLAAEATDNGLLAPEIAAGIQRVRGVKSLGVRAGNWLSKDETERLLNAPDTSTLKGKRDRALLAVLIGCGLRRNEAATLDCAQIQQRDGRWVIVDLHGKHNRVRTVPMPAWTKVAIDQWLQAAAVAQDRIFRPINKGDRISGESMTPQAIFVAVQVYARRLGLPIAPHDLRRTFAKLAHKGRAALEQIQLSLGHASILTTERYLGVRQDLNDAPCDHLGLDLRERT